MGYIYTWHFNILLINCSTYFNSNIPHFGVILPQRYYPQQAPVRIIFLYFRGDRKYPDVMTTSFYVVLSAQLGYFPRSERKRRREIIISSSAQASASASAVDAHWMIWNTSYRLHAWVSLHRNYSKGFSQLWDGGMINPGSPGRCTVVRMRSLSPPWASLLTEAFLITTVAVSAAMAGKTRLIKLITGNVMPDW